VTKRDDNTAEDKKAKLRCGQNQNCDAVKIKNGDKSKTVVKAITVMRLKSKLW
jgi:hypothetical protein